MDAFEGRENRNLNAFRLLSLAAALFLIGTQFGWLNYNGKGACPQVTILNVSSDSDSDDPVSLFEMGLPPDECKPLPPGSALFPGISFPIRNHPYLPYKDLKGRSPPKLLFN
jgi:hypothetical protein